MKIIIETIPSQNHRYPTCGDWQFLEDGTLHILVSEMGNERHEYLVAIHEMVEAILCKWDNVEEPDVAKFDVQFEKDRLQGNNDEPGFDINAPYKNQHLVATGIEMIMCRFAGIDWNDYNKEIFE